MMPPLDTHLLHSRPQHLQPLTEHERAAAKLFPPEPPIVWQRLRWLLAFVIRHARPKTLRLRTGTQY